ncbi:hypothetical protein ACJQWK_07550 [Exserohilum turcicum]|uniref:Glycoside hydrolase family 61 protein n=1 Tax=Exserohilum turcicum (strain 28A) TaxID=671987 RepID=R0IZP8_EXST2|nr:glycoside hydrolase family 61 protein [Exserohilum turcica Et28A]EOA90016.1 glycoside hydrolase family 61 protein [Exserohilum turcica Et28A]
MLPILTGVALSFLFALASAHGRIAQITTSTGHVYKGWDPESSKSLTPPSPLAAWSAANLGNIYVSPSHFNTSNMTCHDNAIPGALHVNTTAGDTLKVKWNEWPVSHVGPVMTYVAKCNGSCAEAKKDDLLWVKIDELAWLNSTGWDKLELGGTWATDVLIANNFTWIVRLPELLEAGNYVMRQEIIALHVAEKLDGAQAYPQCVNLRVAPGKSRPARSIDGGVPGTKLYGPKDEGILVSVHGRIDGYKTPGPRLWRNATPARQPCQ